MNILSDCGSRILERLIDPILNESRNLFCFKCIVDDFEKEKSELKVKLETIDDDVKDAGRIDLQASRRNVTHWKEKAKKLIDEDTTTKMACFGGWCPNCIWRYRRGKELAEMTNEIRTLRGENFERVGRPPHLPGIESRSSQDFIHFKSRVSAFNQLLDAIADENNYITGLHGMGGAGKTELAKAVGGKLKESGKFDCVTIATVSNDPNIEKIQDSIVVPLGLSLNDKNESERLTDGEKILIILDDVWRQISFEEIGIPSRGNHRNCRVLLTSRDVRVCYSMGCQRPIQLGLLSDEDAWLLFKKQAGIDDNDSSFKDFQEKGKEITNECKNLPVAIAAIAGTLKNLSLPEWDATLTALRNPTPVLDVDEGLRKFYECLRCSYDNLKSDKAKRLFLLLSVFPEDTEIPTEYLTRFGIGLGLFGEDDKYCEARRQVLLLKNKLIDSCLWLDAKDDSVKLHDLVREVALWLANKDIQFVELSEKARKALAGKEKKVKYLYCHNLQVKDMDVFPSWFDGSELEFLIISIKASDSVEVPNAFFEKMTKLRVLSLIFLSWSMPALTLPVSLQPLTNVRSLIVHRCKLGDISILKYLRSLETLDLEDCLISEMPNEIAELGKLILLSIRGCEIERNNPFEVIGRCLQLQELYFAGNEFPIPKVIHQNTTFPPTLNKYHLFEHNETIDPISKVVSLPNIDSSISEEIFKNLLQGAEFVRLEGVKGEWRNLVPEIVPMEDNCMKDLLLLSLKSCSKVQCLINTKHSHSRVPNVFSNLVELGLYCMDNLEELCTGPLPFEFLKSLQRLSLEKCQKLQGMLFKSKLNLCNLKIMKLESCPLLASLFELSIAQSLIVLEELRIHECEQLTNIITGEASKDLKEERLDDDNDHTGYDPVFPKLKILEISGCHRLECIFPVLFPRDVPLLETIEIVDCAELKHIFGRYQHDHEAILGSLQVMKLGRLSNFMSISLECYHPVSSSSVRRSISRNRSKTKQQDPNDQKIFSWSYICCYCKKYGPNLRSAKSIKMPVVSKVGQPDCSVPSIPNSSFHFTESAQCVPKQSQGLDILIMRNATMIELTSLDKLKCLFNLSIASSMMVEDLRIESCPGLKHIIDIGDDCDGKNCDAIFPKLKYLSVSNCGQLEYMFHRYPLDHQNYKEIHIFLQALEELNLCVLPNMRICPKNSLSIALPRLEVFEVNGCPLFAETFLNESMVDSDTKQLDHTITKEIQASSLECVQIFDITQSLWGFSQNLFNIRDMSFSNCPKIISMFTFSIASKMLVEKLTITRCDGLKQVIIDKSDVEERKVCNSIFPKLKELAISGCDKLEYVIGPNRNEDCNNNLEFYMDLPVLEILILKNLPEMINLCPKSYIVTCLSLKKFELVECLQFNSRQVISIANKTSSSKCVQTFDITQSLWGYSQNLFNIRKMSFSNCPKIISMFTFSIASKMLVEKLTITRCDELKQVIIDKSDDEERKVCNSVFPKLKELAISGCDKLEYVIGPNRHEDCNHNLEFYMDLPILEILILKNLPEMINICPKSYIVTCLSLKKFELVEYLQFNPRQAISIANKDTRGIEKHFLSLESLCIRDSRVELESVFHLNGHQKIEQPLSLKLKHLELDSVDRMKYICVASKNSLTFQHLVRIRIVGCAELEIVFSTCVLRCLPELKHVEIRECKELKQIVEEDIVENQKLSPQPCFPKLTALIVRQCHKLKHFIASNDLPNLELLIIKGASELEELIGYEKGQGNNETRKVDVMLPRLKVVVFKDLSSLCLGAETLQTARHRVVHNCPKISLTSTASLQKFKRKIYEDPGINGLKLWEISEAIRRNIKEVTNDEESEEDFVGEVGRSEIAAIATSPTNFNSELIDKPSPSPLDITPCEGHSQELENGPSMGESFWLNQQKPLRETESTIEIPQGIDEETTIIGKDLASVKPALTTPLPSHMLEDHQSTREPRVLDQKHALGETIIVEAIVKERVQEVANLTDKEGEIGVVSIDSIATQRNEEPKKEIIGRASISEMYATVTSPTDSDMMKGSSAILSNIPPPKTHSSNELLDEQLMGEACSMNKQKPLGEASTKIAIEEGATFENAKLATLSTGSQPSSSQPGPLVNPQHQPYPHSFEAIVKEHTQEGANLAAKEGEIGVISIDSIVTQRNEELEKDFIERASISEMPATVASPIDSDMIKGSSPNPSDISLHTTHSNSTKRGVEEGATSENARMTTFSTHLKPASSHPGPSVTSQHQSYQHIEVKLSQIETYTNKESEGHPINIQDFRDDDLISLFQLEAKDGDGQIGTPSVSVVSVNNPVTEDNLVVKVLADLEELLNMPLKDIASSKSNSLRLLSALNFLSWLSLEHVTISDGLKTIIDSLHKEFPSLLCSFKQAFATTNKFAVLEEKEKSIKGELAHRKEVATSLVSEIFKARNFMDEAKQKEAMLKEQMNGLEKEMKACEANLSFLQEEKKKLFAETLRNKMDFETVRNDKSQMVEDQRKAQQELLEVDYKWSVLCSQFEHNRITTNNPS